MGVIDRSIPVYPIGVAQKLTGLSARQIRYYEQTGLIRPKRTKGNQRLFSPDDVDRLLYIKSLLAEGLTIEGARARLERADRSGGSAPVSSGGAGGGRAMAGINHDYIITQMRAGKKLASLYPVDNQAELVRLIEARRQDEAR